MGLCKPDPRIYQLCADRLGVSPQEAVFLDDLSFNVEAAVQVGMHGITVSSVLMLFHCSVKLWLKEGCAIWHSTNC